MTLRLTLATPLLVAALLQGPPAARAQQPLAALEGQQAAQDLAKRSIDCLRRGEDAINTGSRLAAYREGFDLAQRALVADDNNADAHYALFANRGRILLLEGATPNPFNLLQVNRELDRALALDPDHADALAAKGGLYRQLPRILGGSLDRAEEYLTRAIALDPDAVGARIELAETYREMGQPQRGVPLLEAAVEVAERKGNYRQVGEARTLLRRLQPDR